MNYFKSLFMLVILCSSQALADQVNALRFKPALSADSIYVEGGTDTFRGFGKEYNGLVSVFYESIDNPVSVVEQGGQQIVTDIVRSLDRARIMGAIQIKRFTIGANIPFDKVVSLQPFNTAGNNTLGSLNYEESSWTLGDIHVTGKFRLFKKNHEWNWTLISDITLPTGNEEIFNTDDSLGFGLGIGFTKHINVFWKIYGNVGYAFARNSKLIINRTFKVFDASQRLNAGAGINYHVLPWLSTYLETAAQVGVPFNDFQNPVALHLGANLYWKNFIFSAGYGLEEHFDEEHSEKRFFAGLKFQFSKSKTWNKEQAKENFKKNQSQLANIVYAKKVTSPPAPQRAFSNHWSPIETFGSATNVYFSTGRSDLIPIFHPMLDRLAETLKSQENKKIVASIEGHTDKRGSAEDNMKLSEQRAMAVYNYFISKHQIEPSRFEVSYKGVNDPISKGTDDYAQTLNRRVEIKIIQ